MNVIKHFFYDWFVELGLSQNIAKYLNMFLLLIIALAIVFVIDIVVRRILRYISIKIAERTKTKFDNILITNKLPRNFAHIIPVFLLLELTPVIFGDFELLKIGTDKIIKVFVVILTLWIVRSILNSMKDFLKQLPRFKDKPIESYIQVVMIFAWMAGFILVFAILTGRSIWAFFTALGAASAIIILIFRDTILGFVASIQVTVNDMVRIGDWITFDKYGADGDVTEISLATVKVQNFDKTITTIPTYALISDSFKNWRGMVKSDGRRIKRSIFIKMDSIKYLSREDIEKLKKIQLINAYLNNKTSAINEYNEKHNIDKSLLINGRNLTNIGVFRKYAQSYIQQHSAINNDMMIMVRQLQPTTQGLPLEVYAFSSDKRWENYEYIIADIFDHLLASLKYFDLKLFELPTNINA